MHLETERRLHWERGAPAQLEDPESRELLPVSMFRLLDALKACSRARCRRSCTPYAEPISLKKRSASCARSSASTQAPFEELLDRSCRASRRSPVPRLLELLKQGTIQATQESLFGPIWIEWRRPAAARGHDGELARERWTRDPDTSRSRGLLFASDAPSCSCARRGPGRPGCVRGRSILAELGANTRRASGRGPGGIAGGYRYSPGASARLDRGDAPVAAQGGCRALDRDARSSPQAADHEGRSTGSAQSTPAALSHASRAEPRPDSRPLKGGRPLLYGTTPDFLSYMGVNELSDLPELKELGSVLESASACTVRSRTRPRKTLP
jgi:hypothetical protein